MANIAQAIRMALHVGETQLGVTEIFGEDVGAPLGGVFTCTQGLERAWNSPLDERGIVGTALGLALAGQKPVAEIQFCDYAFNTIDLLKLCGNCCWSSAGEFGVPMVLMTPVGSGIHGSIYHSHSFDATATRIPGWKIVLPSNPLEAYGLLISAIKDPNPVMFLYPKALIRVPGEEKIPGEPEDPKELSRMIDAPVGDRSKWKPKWPKLADFEVPLGVARVRREGTDVTVVSYGRTLPLCLKAAEALSGKISAEVIDLRTLWPLGFETIKTSLKKTRRIVVVNEDTEVTNFGEHIIRRVLEECFYELEAPPKLVAGAHLPGVGMAWTLESVSVPQQNTIEQAIREVTSAEA